MASLVDSEAQFRTRSSEIGLGDNVINALVASGINSMAKLAFAVGQPGQAIVTADVENLLQDALGRAGTIGQVSCAKRLLFEAQTVIIASLKASVEGRSEDEPKRIPAAERLSRMEDARARMPGLRIQGDTEPAHSLLDLATALYEANTVKYIAPEKCVSRSYELVHSKPGKELSLEHGSIAIKDKDSKLVISTDTEMQLHQAFVRRGIALEFAQVLSFQVHEAWANHLFSCMTQDVPTGYSRPTVQQLLLADKAAWTKLAESVPRVRRSDTGDLPLDTALQRMTCDPIIMMHLLPLGRSSSSSGPPTKKVHHEPAESSERPWKQQKTRDKGQGKGKSKKGGIPSMPKELHNKWFKNAQGEPLCFAFNTTAGCSSGLPAGQKCPKGWHLCCEPKCLGNHSLPQHGKR